MGGTRRCFRLGLQRGVQASSLGQVSAEKKLTGSTAGMRTSVETSPLLRVRLAPGWPRARPIPPGTRRAPPRPSKPRWSARPSPAVLLPAALPSRDCDLGGGRRLTEPCLAVPG